MPLNADAIRSVAFLTEGGGYKQPADSGLGGLYRPFASGQSEAPTATLETLYDYWINHVPNPDQAQRLDPGIRDKIRMHPDCAADMRKREVTVASFPDRIEPNPNAPDGAVAKTIAEYVDRVWRQIPEIRKLYQAMQEAVMGGGQGIEFMWHREANGLERPYRWHSVHSSRFVFDRLGNMALLTRAEPVWGAYVAMNPQINGLQQPHVSASQFPLGKFIYHVHRREPGTWSQPELEGYQFYGVGEDVALYYVVTFDCFVLRMRLKLLEKFGFPPTDIYYPDNTSPAQLRRIADSVRGESVTTIPHPVGVDIDKMWKIVTREFPKLSYDAFENFSEKWTRPRVSRILLGSAEEGQKSEQGGGFSDHVSRRESGPQVWFQWDALNISETINNQLIPSIVWHRFPNCPMEYMPQHRLEPKEERDRAQEADILEKSTKFIDISKSEAYERLGYKAPKPGEQIIQVKAAQNPAQPPPGQGGGQPMPSQRQNIAGQPQNQMRTPIGAKGGKSSVAYKGVTMPRDGSV